MATELIEIPDLDDDDSVSSPLAHLAINAPSQTSLQHARTGSFAGAGIPALPPLRNPFTPQDGLSSPVENRSRAGSVNQSAVTPGGLRRGHHPQSSSSGSSFPSSVGGGGGAQSPLTPLSHAGPSKMAPSPATQAEAASELALGHILESFIEAAEQRIGEALAKSLEQEVFFPSLLAEGVDPAFDQLIFSIGRIAKRLPKLVIDMIMRWRKSQNEGIDAANVQRAVASAPNPAAARTIVESMSERKTLASIHVLCRVLTVVIGAVDRQTLGEELGAKLEDIIFNSLKNADPLQVQRSANRRANMELYARLIGSLSAIRFVGVSDRFISELEQINRGYVTKDTEPRVEHLISGMRYLKLQVFPPDAFEDSAEFMEALASIFDAASGSRIKIALATVLVPLVGHVTRAANAEIHHPLWSRAMQMIHTRAVAMSAKPRYVVAALPLICTSISASPEDMLLANWNAALDLCFNKLKDKSARPSALYGIVQILWAYLRRCQESHSAVAKRLDPLFRTFFPPGRRSLYPVECPVDLAACIPHMILCRHFELGSEMISSLLVSATDGVSLEGLAPERLTAAFGAIMQTLDCFERGVEPVMPPIIGDYAETPAPLATPLPSATLSRIGLKGLLEQATTAIAIAASACDRGLSSSTVLEDSFVMPASATYYTPDKDTHLTRRHGNLTVTYARDRQPFFDLQRACFNAWPRCMKAESPDFRPIDMLLRALLHIDPDVCESAKHALERLAKLTDGARVVRLAFRFLAQPDFVIRENAALQAGTTAKMQWLVETCLDLARIWQIQLQSATKQAQSDTPAPRRPLAADTIRESPMEEIDPQQSWILLPELEAVGLVLLCADACALRNQAIEVLNMAVMLEKQLADWAKSKGLAMESSGRRILHALDGSAAIMGEIDEDRVPAQDRLRLHRLRKAPDALRTIVQSDGSFEFGLWQMVLGTFLAQCIEQSARATTLARPLFAARVLRLHHIASVTAGLSPPRILPTTPLRERPQFMPQSPNESPSLVEAWRTHLTALCALTSSPNLTAVGEHDVSGVDLIRFVIPFLASEQVGLRDAVVSGLGNVNIGLYRTLLESMQAIIRHLAEERKARNAQPQIVRRSKRFDRLHISVARIFELNSRLLRQSVSSEEGSEALLGPLIFFVRETAIFFRDPGMHEDTVAINMRRSYCNVTRDVVDFCSAHKVIDHWLPADLQHELFVLLDSWSFRPYGPISPDTSRGPRSTGSHGHHTNQSRGSSLGSAPSTFEVYLPATAAIVSLCESNGLAIKRDIGDRANGQIEAQDILRWSQALFEQINVIGHGHARRALLGLMRSNTGHKTLLDAIAYQCFSEPESLQLQQSTWSVVSEALLTIPNLAVKQSTLFCLALWKMGHPDLQTRQRAVDVLAEQMPVEQRSAVLQRCETALFVSFPGAALQARRDLSAALASCHADEAKSVFLELTIRILQIGSKQTRLLLQLLPSWIASLQLPPPDRSKATDPTLANLFLLSAKYGDMYYAEMRELWEAVAAGNDGANFKVLLRFLVNETVRRGSKDFARHAQRVVGCLCECSRSAALLQELADLVQPAEMAGSSDIETTPLASSQNVPPRRTNLDTLFPVHTRKIAASSAQAALLLVGDALVSRLSTADPCIARLLHGYVVAVDHSTVFVRTHARDCLLRCLTLLEKLADTTRTANPGENLSHAESQPWRALWEHDESGADSPQTQHTPRNMSGLIETAVRLLEVRIPEIRRLWGGVALDWATSCPLRHIACRSFQAFRLLMPPISQRMLADMLARLSSTIADEIADNRLFAREISWTITSIVQAAEPQAFVELPQVLWASAICLDTTVETEFEEAILALDGCLEKLEAISDKALGGALEICRPPSLASPGASLVRLIAYKGLRSSTTCNAAYTLLRRLASSRHAGLVAPAESSLALLYATAMLYGIQALEESKIDPDLESFALQIAALGTTADKSNISRIMTSLAKNRFRTKEDFLRQSTGNLVEYFSINERVDVMLLFLSNLFNPIPWVRLRSMTLLKAFAKQGCLRDVDAEQLPPDALRPLLELLSGEYSKAALEVMDEALPGARRLLAGPGRPATSLSVRRGRNMSLGDHVDRAVFGETTASGWSVPTSKAARQGIRHRLREVVDTCSGLSKSTSSRSGSPIAFAIDDFDASSAALDVNAADLQASDTGDASTLGDMVDALHDLGSFFEDGASTASSASVPTPSGLMGMGIFGDRTGLEAASAAPSFRMSQALGSASRVAAVLARSLRSSSHSSAHNLSNGGTTPRMATIAESSQTPFNAAFAEKNSGLLTPRVESIPLQRQNSAGVYSTASSSAAGSASPGHRRNGTADTLSSDSEGESAWGDEDPASASSHENLHRKLPSALSFTPMWNETSHLSDGDDDNVFGFDDAGSTAGHKRRFLHMKKRATPSPHRTTFKEPL